MGVMSVVEAEAGLHAQTTVVGGTIAAVYAHDVVILHVIGELAADTAIRTDRIDFLVSDDGVGVFGRRERSGGACLHAFTARHTGRFPHRVVKIEHDLGGGAAERVADHVIDLLLAAGAHATRALDAGVQVYPHRGVRDILRGLASR